MRLPQGAEWLIIVLLIVLLFGAKRLPDAARGLGRSLRIFKAETKGLADDTKAAAQEGASGADETTAVSGRAAAEVTAEAPQAPQSAPQAAPQAAAPQAAPPQSAAPQAPARPAADSSAAEQRADG